MKPFTTVAVTSLCLILTLADASAQSPDIDRIEVVDHGIYIAETVKAGRDTQGVLHGFSRDVHHVRTTRTIPAEPLVRFGFRFKLLGVPTGSKVTLRKVWIFPPEGLRHPKTQKILYRLERNVAYTVGETSYTAYKFDDPWEMVPGPWTVELWYGNRKLVTQHFTVVRP